MKTLITIILFVSAVIANAAAPIVTPLGSLSAQLHGPARVAVDGAGQLYVTDPAAGRVVIFNAFGQQVGTVDGFAGPLAIAIASDGRIYLSEEKSGTVSVFDSQWNLLYQLGAGTGEFQLPGHLAVDPQSPETVYVSDGPANLVRKYVGNAFAGQFGAGGSANGQFMFVAGVAVRANGEVLVVDQNNDRVQVFTNGVFARKFSLGSGGMFGGPSGRSQALFVDASGRAFVADSEQGCVKVYDVSTGALLGYVGAFGGARGQLSLPLGVVLDGQNRLCVASANNSRIELFGMDQFLHLTVNAVDGQLASGSNLVFSVISGSTNQPVFQWQKNGVSLTGATNRTLLIANASAGDSGNYSVVVGEASGSVTSSVAPVTVVVAPELISAPNNQTIKRGELASFFVYAAGNDLKYQWQLNGNNLSGATNASLTLAEVQPEQAGLYVVHVSNAAGTISAGASLTVQTPPMVMDVVSGTPTPEGSFQLTMNVEPGFNYELQASSDLLQWDSLWNFSAEGLCDFADTGATNLPARFYRLRWIP